MRRNLVGWRRTKRRWPGRSSRWDAGWGLGLVGLMCRRAGLASSAGRADVGWVMLVGWRWVLAGWGGAVAVQELGQGRRPRRVAGWTVLVRCGLVERSVDPTDDRAPPASGDPAPGRRYPGPLGRPDGRASARTAGRTRGSGNSRSCRLSSVAPWPGFRRSDGGRCGRGRAVGVDRWAPVRAILPCRPGCRRPRKPGRVTRRVWLSRSSAEGGSGRDVSPPTVGARVGCVSRFRAWPPRPVRPAFGPAPRRGVAVWHR